MKLNLTTWAVHLSSWWRKRCQWHWAVSTTAEGKGSGCGRSGCHWQPVGDGEWWKHSLLPSAALQGECCNSKKEQRKKIEWLIKLKRLWLRKMKQRPYHGVGARCFLPIDEKRRETWRAVNLCYNKKRYLPHGTHCCKLKVLKNSLLIMGTYSEYLNSLIIVVWFSSRYKILCTGALLSGNFAHLLTGLKGKKRVSQWGRESEMGQLSGFTCWALFEC